MLADYVVLDCTDRSGWLAGRVLADLGAEVFKIEMPATPVDEPAWQAYNVNKQLLVLDLQSDAGAQHFDKLILKADILLVSSLSGSNKLSNLFVYDRLAVINPKLILVHITPFGTEGPRAHWRATDLELMASGGAMSLAGEPDSTPVRITEPQSYAWTGVQAAVGALTALNARRLTNKGQEVLVSAQASVLPALAFAPAYWDMLRINPTRAGSFTVGRTVTGARFRAFWPCQDGFLNFIIYGGPAGRRTNKQLVAWMQERKAELGVLGKIDWDVFNQVHATQSEIDAMEEPIAGFFLTLSKNEFLEEASKREILGYPVFTVADIAADLQLKERNFWSDLQGPDGVKQRHCGAFYIVDGERPPLKYPVSGKVNLESVLEQLEQREKSDTSTANKQNDSLITASNRALEGVKVLEFGGYAAGPQIGKILANFGATVIHIESPNRPDGFRLEYPPFKDGKPGLNRGGCFSIFNDSKYAVTVDVKKLEGIELARRMVNWADIVIENMRPGVIARMGLGYETFAESNPGLVMLSTCNMGQTGSRAMTPGFGTQLSALAGFSGLTGSSDGPPMLLYGPYIDFIAANFGAAAVLGALQKSRNTGKGSRLDLSQYETGLLFIAGALLEYHTTGKVAQRSENADPISVPHGAYRCIKDKWITLSCWSEEEFASLVEIMGNPELAKDSRFGSSDNRKKHEAELNQIISDWCRNLDAEQLAETLQNNGICSYPVNTVADVFTDPQLSKLKVWRWRRHPVIGLYAYMFPSFDLGDTPGDIYNPAPLFGGDNDIVFSELIGLDEKELKEYRENGTVG